MTSNNQYLTEIFPEPPFSAFKKQANLKQYLIRATVPPANQRPMRQLTLCGKECAACPYIMEGRNIKINKNQIRKIKKESELFELQPNLSF